MHHHCALFPMPHHIGAIAFLLGAALPVKIGLCSDTSNGIHFAFPLAHKASRGSIVDYASDNLNTQPLAKVTAKADRLSQLRHVGIRQ
jgi:hypothetical protein